MMVHFRPLIAVLSTGIAILASPVARAETIPECNSYYPLPLGGTWTYRESTGDGDARATKVVRVVSAEGPADERRATLEQEVITPVRPATAAGRARLEVRCEDGQISMTLRGAARSREGDSTAQAVVTARLSGLPPARLLVAGYTWESTSTIETREGETSSMTQSRRRSKVIGPKSISVPAGNFPQALEIHGWEALEQAGQGRSIRQEIRSWYVRGVGLVKRETRVIDHPAVMSSTETLTSTTLIAGD